jgi:hypothetical protein
MTGRRRLLAALGVALTAALASASSSVHAATPAAVEGVPRVDHVVTLVLENESFSATWGANSPAKYLNGLITQGAFVPNYFATGHVSLDNYIAMTSGLAGPQIAATYTDCLGLNLYACVQHVSLASTVSGSVADEMETAGVTWKQYSDGSTAPCVHADYSPTAQPDTYQGAGATKGPGAGPDYSDRHVPFLYYSNIIGNDQRCASHLRPYTDLAGDVAANKLPNYSFITPDTCNDGHDATCSSGRPGGLVAADAFLSAQVPALLSYLRSHNGVLFIAFDEGNAQDTAGCCNGGPAGQRGFGGQTGMLVLGAPVLTTKTDAQYDHASLLRTTEDMLGITTHLNNAASAQPITGIWKAPREVESESSGSGTPASPGSQAGGGGAGSGGQPPSAAAAAVSLPSTSPTGMSLPATGLALGLVALVLGFGSAHRRRTRRRSDTTH